MPAPGRAKTHRGERLKTGVKPRQQQKPAEAADKANAAKKQPTAVVKAKRNKAVRNKPDTTSKLGEITSPT
jgi:hypothetical protein